jgi:hypothetical protein
MQAYSSPRKNDGITYARTREGFDLPVIDVTNPRFAVPDDPATVRGLHDAFIEGERRRRRIPQFIMRMMLGAAAKQSRLVRALFNSDDGFLDGMTTYVMKLGADNLVPPYDTLIDRRLAASPLEGLDIDMRCHDYDWDQPPLLKCLVERLTSAGAIIAPSSEGALFEYGSDQAIVANLQALRFCAFFSISIFTCGLLTSRADLRCGRVLIKSGPMSASVRKRPNCPRGSEMTRCAPRAAARKRHGSMVGARC